MSGSGYRHFFLLLVLALALADACLVAWQVREQFFVSMPLVQFAVLAWGGVAGVVTAAATMVRIGSALSRAMRGDKTKPKPFSIDGTVQTSYAAIKGLIGSLPKSISASVLLAVGGYLLIVYAKDSIPEPAASTVAVETKGSEKFIYIADGLRGAVRMTRSSELSKFSEIPMGTSGNLGERGAPGALLATQMKGGAIRLFVADTKVNKVFVVDGDTVVAALPAGPIPRSLAITSDKRKLFVSNEQSIPTGSISVFDITDSDPAKFTAGKPITGVNCPEGMALSPRGDYLYVASQCGGSKDPVFIVDTATQKVVGSIPDLAVGTMLAVSPDGDRLYVARGDFPCVSPEKKMGSPLSVVDIKKRKIINTICLRTSVGTVAVSRDHAGKYLLVANGDWLTVFDRKSLDSGGRQLNDVPLDTAISGFGVSADNSVFAYLPKSGTVFVYGLNGL